MSDVVASQGEPVIRTPDQRLRVFISSTLTELAEERAAARAAVERLHLIPVMFELGARPHPPRNLYRAYLAQSHVFVGIYGDRYGWVAPDEEVSGLEDEYRLSGQMPQLLYVRETASGREPRLEQLLDGLRADGRASYRRFASPTELAELLEEDLAVLLTERFQATAGSAGGGPPAGAPHPRVSAPPIPITRTIGRDEVVAELTNLLTVERVRLVTITGPGGIGKSRTALEVARRVGGAFADGVHLVPLEPLSDPAAVLRVLADGLGVPGEGRRALDDLVVDHLADRDLLLLFDNFEQVIDAAPVVAGVLDRCPGVQALVTSRRVLRLRGEREYPLAPLEVPAEDDGDAAGTSAVELFVERARAVRPDFVLTPEHLPAVAELVRRLDGLPLAIELAAARTRVLAPDVLLDRLEEQLDVLSSGAVDLPERQRTLRATIDWSYRLLQPHERRLFDRLSVFAGAFSLEAAESVCGEPGDPDLLETLSSLLESSLVLPVADRAEPRLQLLRTVRVYASARLTERGEVVAVADRHADWFLGRAARVDPLSDPEAHRRSAEMVQESDDIRAAMEWVVRDGDPVRTAAFARATWMWFWLRGRLSEVREWFEAAGRLVEEVDTTPADRAAVLYGLGQVREIVGDSEGCVEVMSQALELFREVGNDVGVAGSHIALSAALPYLGRTDEALEHAVAAAEIGERVGEPHLIGYANAIIGTWRMVAGDLAGSRQAHERARAVAERVGFGILFAQEAAQLAMVDAVEGDLDTAWRELRAVAAPLAATGSREVLSYWLESAAVALATGDDPAAALRALTAADRIRAELGIVIWPLLWRSHDDLVARVSDGLGEEAATAVRATVPHDGWALMHELLAGRADTAAEHADVR